MKDGRRFGRTEALVDVPRRPTPRNSLLYRRAVSGSRAF
jgi:hypothetical protein